jgi:hypothetical protein
MELIGKWTISEYCTIINLVGLWETIKRLKQDGWHPYVNSKGVIF